VLRRCDEAEEKLRSAAEFYDMASR